MNNVRFEDVAEEAHSSSSYNPESKSQILCDPKSSNSITTDESLPERRNTSVETGFSTFKRIWREKKIAQADFEIVAHWAVIGNVLAVLIFYGVMYTWCALVLDTQDPSKVAMPWGNNDTIVVLVTITFCTTFMLIVVCTGCCIWKRDHPLVKARGIVFVSGIGITALLVSVTQYSIVLTYFLPTLWEGRKHHLNTYLAMGEYITVTSTLALIVAREGIIFMIFIQTPYRGKISYNGHFAKVVGGMFILSLFSFMPYLLATVLDWEGRIYYTLFVLIPWEVAIGVLAYYTYRTRDVSSSFSDWKSNFRIGIVLAVGSNLIVFSMVIDFGAPEYGVLPGSWELFVFYFASMAKIAYTVLDLFALLAVISVSDMKIIGKLSPRATTLVQCQSTAVTTSVAVKQSRIPSHGNPSLMTTASVTSI
ncbi:hypothetical protein SARC_03100 [Sphaeroforma arctica JP610]|uniref:Uncharacterized protein n=1 Tax=Sphaeroforma arctica JP610 TaxID=667725 RepID=A0A0L0G6Q3_9EUKA|nr:hypothetical protein SARC_03100 [Sphaeroforma arctica JP610]KNC84695.1 hypothetical protein SARC_03100 [Sphaeroforma arctica JP610]|eukprot:XP_014158597.1 hypothetical protein SARC_03100 [Sphaeroforma arctica JP610]